MLPGRSKLVQYILLPARNIIPGKVGENFSREVLQLSLSLSFHIGADSPFSVETLIPRGLSWLHIVFKVELSSRTKCKIEKLLLSPNKTL